MDATTPDSAIDLTADGLGLVWFVAIAFGLPLLGWLAAVLDYRAYLRSLRGALVVVRRYALDAPLWALRDRPACLEALGLAPGCTRDEVMAAYRQRVKKVHPDHGGDRRRFDQLQQRFREAIKLVEASESV